jgi:hypothetical protein
VPLKNKRMKESVQIAAFNRYLLEFTNDITKRFPHDQNVRSLKLLNGFLAISPNSNIPTNTFKKHVTLQLAKDCKDCNEAIFADGYEIASIADGQESDVFAIIRTLWQRLDAEEKVFIWQYLQTFIKIIGM